MKRGNIWRSQSIQLSNDEVINSVGDGEGYQYLAINNFKEKELRNKGKGEKRIFLYYKTLKSNLNSGNGVKPINSRALAVIRYCPGVIMQRNEDLRTTDRETRKSIMPRELHPQADADSL